MARRFSAQKREREQKKRERKVQKATKAAERKAAASAEGEPKLPAPEIDPADAPAADTVADTPRG